MVEFTYEEGDGEKYRAREDVTSVKFSLSCTLVGVDAFYGCLNLLKVDFGSSPISKIIEGAFYATKVEEIILPEALEELGSLEDSDGVFEDCECLRRVVVGGRCRVLGRESFRGCKSLREVVGGGGVTDIGKWAFGKNVVLEEMTLPKCAVSIGDNCFKGCTRLHEICGSKDQKVIVNHLKGVDEAKEKEAELQRMVDERIANIANAKTKLQGIKDVDVRQGVGMLQERMFGFLETGEVKGAQGAFDEIKGLAEKNYKRLVELTNVAMLKYRMTESRRFEPISKIGDKAPPAQKATPTALVLSEDQAKFNVVKASRMAESFRATMAELAYAMNMAGGWDEVIIKYEVDNADGRFGGEYRSENFKLDGTPLLVRTIFMDAKLLPEALASAKGEAKFRDMNSMVMEFEDPLAMALCYECLVKRCGVVGVVNQYNKKTFSDPPELKVYIDIDGGWLGEVGLVFRDVWSIKKEHLVVADARKANGPYIAQQLLDALVPVAGVEMAGSSGVGGSGGDAPSSEEAMLRNRIDRLTRENDDLRISTQLPPEARKERAVTMADERVQSVEAELALVDATLDSQALEISRLQKALAEAGFSKSGVLQKKSKYLKKWADRKVTLDSSGKLTWDGGSGHKGFLVFKKGDEVKLFEGGGFNVVAGGRIVAFKAANSAVAAEWAEAIQKFTKK
ncbi:hypothetical protein TrVE_jg7176 [Triparma verrucosa]|uniref:PH domain-containing protein n=1 Tax=Triparma verrucosa TaxID=1606542 RepID=A0A9W7CBM8_9STRA|nr:hypothetical protein TrVE_jg7176 [Triparma verrucosa]